MADKTSFPKAARGYEGNVVAVNDKVCQIPGLLYAVAEIVRRQVALGDEWIHNCHSVLIKKRFKTLCKDNYNLIIKQEPGQPFNFIYAATVGCNYSANGLRRLVF